ncbi:MAG: DUF1501 domain-containing protein [Planctomycetales bacterium]
MSLEKRGLTEETLLRAHGQTRRRFLGACGMGLGQLALGEMLRADTTTSRGVNPLSPKAPHFAAKAKRVIYLDMAGAPPQHDLFDYKPLLNKHHLQPCPDELLKGQRFPFIKGHPKLLGTPHKFRQRGESGAWVSDLLPHFTEFVDDAAIIRSMYTDQFNHAPAELFIFTGSPRFGGASMGSWITYGLGSENQDLPGYVVLVSGGTDPTGGKSLWGSGFLPSVYQGVQCRSGGDPILYTSNPQGMTRDVRRQSLDTLKKLNELELQRGGDPETQTRISQYELAFRMQMSVPAVMDLSKESRYTQEMYGAEPGRSSFANNCLLARRLVESGVRYVQLFDWGWDMHGTAKDNDVVTGLPRKCKEVDQPIAALLRDLKQRDLLKDTLVIWGGEFGRTSMNEARNGSPFLGRDHHPHCFTIWMAGGGIKGGIAHGETDDLGYFVSKDKMSVRDLQATILHLLGLDPFKFSYAHNGLQERLVGPTAEGAVRKALLA